MPRVTPAFTEQQRRRILTAAAQCFAREGFHATSMGDLITTVGMSSSTVYRYFPGGKQELVEAVTNDRVERLTESIRALTDEAPTLGARQAFERVIEALAVGDPRRDPAATGRLAVNAWAELPRNGSAGALMRDHFALLQRHLDRLLQAWIDREHIPGPLGTARAVAVRYTLGYLAEVTITGATRVGAAADQFADALGVRATRGDLWAGHRRPPQAPVN